jgi:hypothetical protein
MTLSPREEFEACSRRHWFVPLFGGTRRRFKALLPQSGVDRTVFRSMRIHLLARAKGTGRIKKDTRVRSARQAPRTFAFRVEARCGRLGRGGVGGPVEGGTKGGWGRI